MNLTEKRALFSAWHKKNPERHTISGRKVKPFLDDISEMSLFRKNLLSALISQDPMVYANKRLLEEELSNTNHLLETLCDAVGDTAPHCEVDHFAATLAKIGFEKVGEFHHTYEAQEDPDSEVDLDIQNITTDLMDKGIIVEKTFIHARPDGLIVTWATAGEDFCESATLIAQWVPKDPNNCGIPESSIVYRGELKDGKPFFIIVQEVDAGLISTIKTLRKNGRLCSPWLAKHEQLQNVFVSDYDAQFGMEDLVDRQRALAMPAWVKEMIGEKPTPPAIVAVDDLCLNLH